MLYFLRYLVAASRGVMGRSLLLSEAAQFLCLLYQPAGKAAEQTLLAISICIEAFEMKVMKSGDILCVLGGSSGWLMFSMDFYFCSISSNGRLLCFFPKSDALYWLGRKVFKRPY